MQVMREIRDEKLDFWIRNNLNVLLIGHYGAGKTTRILDAFKRHKLKFKYFSASTMDPWCDFIGVPKVMTDERGAYLDYILPRDFRDDTIEAIYMDEFNRSHKKVRNAVMELLQFKSMNGRPFNNLRMIWASINPEDEGDYQVDALDKGQKDRFQVQVGVPYEPKLEYFTNKFDHRQAKVAVNWWESLSDEQKMEVSPRRLEYALQVFNMPGGDIKDVLPHSSGPSKLSSLLKTGPIDERLKDLFKANDLEAAKKYLQVENNYAAAAKYLCGIIPDNVDENNWKLFFLQAISIEKLASMMATNEAAYRFIIANVDSVPLFTRMVRDALTTNTDKVLVRRLKKELDTNKLLAATFGAPGNASYDKPWFSNRVSPAQWSTRLAGWISQPLDTTPQRLKVYEELADWIPRTLTLSEAVDTLEMISMLAGRSHSSTLKQMRHVLGITNHCIDQINKASGLSWNEILTNYGQKFDKLLDKMRDSGMDKRLYCPVKKAN
jgi:MoxR-like ATPase